jgi:acyl-CoA synthetase (NDP forming)
MAITVPTALGHLGPGILSANITKPLVAVMLDQQESVGLRHSTARRRRQEHRASAASGTGTGTGTGAQDLQPADGQLPADGQQADDEPGQAIPSYLYPESAARALGHAVRYSAWRSSAEGQVPELTGIRQDDARQIVARFLAGQHLGGWLPPGQVAKLLACYGIALVPTLEAADVEAAVRTAASLDGSGVVLKADVTGLVHKSDAGAVLLDLRGERDVRRGYTELSRRFGDDLLRVLIQPMITEGVELLIGVVHEPVFGPLVVFGLGGVATDVLGDHAARLTPLTDVDAEDMIRGIRAAPLLYGHRGSPPVDLNALADVLLRISRLADEVPEIAELDLNPVIARTDGVSPVDARIRLVPGEPTDPFLRRLR